MDVNRSESTVQVIKRDARSDQRPRDEQEEEQQEEEGWNQPSSGHAWSDDDAVDLGGALGGALTPEAQAALQGLAARMEPMRQELERARKREADLRGRLEKHPYLPVLNRHGLEHEVSRVAARASQVGRAPAFLCMTIRNALAVRRKFGRAAYDEMMIAACEVLRGCLDDADIVGCLGGDDLGAIVLSPPVEADRTPLDVLAGRVRLAFESASVTIDGARQPLQVDIGTGEISVGGTFNTALAAADADLMRRAQTV